MIAELPGVGMFSLIHYSMEKEDSCPDDKTPTAATNMSTGHSFETLEGPPNTTLASWMEVDDTPKAGRGSFNAIKKLKSSEERADQTVSSEVVSLSEKEKPPKKSDESDGMSEENRKVVHRKR